MAKVHLTFTRSTTATDTRYLPFFTVLAIVIVLFVLELNFTPHTLTLYHINVLFLYCFDAQSCQCISRLGFQRCLTNTGSLAGVPLYLSVLRQPSVFLCFSRGIVCFTGLQCVSIYGLTISPSHVSRNPPDHTRKNSSSSQLSKSQSINIYFWIIHKHVIGYVVVRSQ